MFITAILSAPAEAQGPVRHPKEKVYSVMNAATSVFVGHATNCTIPGTPCYMVYIPPHNLSALEYLMENYIDPFSLYYPFTPCLFSLPPVKVEPPSIPITLPTDYPGIFGRLTYFGFIPPVVNEECLNIVDTSFMIARLNEDLSSFYAGIGSFFLSFTKVAENWPIKRVTAPYGYSVGYPYGFHEGMDTSIKDCEEGMICNAIYTPIPLMPLTTRGGWAMGIAPCSLNESMFSDDPYPAFLEGIRKLERGEDTCALLFGGFHLVSEFPHLAPGKAAIEMNRPENKGKLPVELGIMTKAREIFALCATQPGYAGKFAPHCHYQAGLISGEEAKRILADMRRRPQEYFKNPVYLATHKEKDWQGPISFGYVYLNSIDPALLLWPSLYDVDNLSASWAQHPWPDTVKVDSDSAPSAWWHTPGRGEYILGILAQGEIENRGGGACLLPNKKVPGDNCYPPNGNYYNAISSVFSRERQAEVEQKLAPVLRLLQRLTAPR